MVDSDMDLFFFKYLDKLEREIWASEKIQE